MKEKQQIGLGRGLSFCDNIVRDNVANQQQSLAAADGQWKLTAAPSPSTPRVSVKEVYNRTVLSHMFEEDGMSLEEQHRNCPQDYHSWCKFWSDRTKYNDAKVLSAVFMPELTPIFTRLSNDTLY